jgi:hypothetical protein
MTSNCSHITCQGKECRRPAKKKLRTPIRKVSKKQAREKRKYLSARIKYLIEHVHCEARLPGCENMTTEVHHMAGRVGKNLLNEKKWLAVCRNCHQRIETRVNEAKQLGLSESRLTCRNETV